LATFAAFLTAFYMTRQMYMVFAGKWRGGDHGYGHGHHEPHEVPWNMWLPIAVLSVFALALGFFGTPLIGGNLFHHYLGVEEEMPEGGVGIVMGCSILVGALGVLLGWMVYGRKQMEHATDPDPLESPLWRVLNNKWYVDEFYGATIIRLTMTCGMMFRLFDKLVVDGILHTIVWLTKAISQIFRWVGDELIINGGFDAGCESVRGSGALFSKLQSGRVRDYFAFLGVGTIVLLTVYFLKQ
jgi:NADH-quinone oxidoreductase subunit L